MPLKVQKPMTPGQRGQIRQTTEDITTSRPKKSLLKPLKKRSGRNHQGRITVRHRGGGHKRRYRVIDFKRDKPGVPGEVVSIENRPESLYPNRACQVPGRRLALHPGAQRAGSRRYCGGRRTGRDTAGQRASAQGHTRGYTGTQCRTAHRSGRPDSPGSRNKRPGTCERGQLHSSETAFGRDAERSERLHGDRRSAQRAGSYEHQAWQGGPQAAPRPASRSSGRGHVSERPSARRRRGAFAHRYAESQDSMGQARARIQNAKEQTHGQVYRPAKI